MSAKTFVDKVSGEKPAYEDVKHGVMQAGKEVFDAIRQPNYSPYKLDTTPKTKELMEEIATTVINNATKQFKEVSQEVLIGKMAKRLEINLDDGQHNRTDPTIRRPKEELAAVANDEAIRVIKAMEAKVKEYNLGAPQKTKS